MRICKTVCPVLLFICFLALMPRVSWPQFIIGQYEDEAPFRTWNTFGIKTASSVGMGEVQFSLARDCSVSLVNPALLTELRKITLTANATMNAASFFKYAAVNTGVLTSQGSLFARFYAFDFFGLAFHLGDFALGVSWGEVERYARPRARTEYSPQGILAYFFELNQRGSLKNINVSLAWRFLGRISLGLGLNYVSGSLIKDITESWVASDITITDSKSHDFKGYYLNGGLSLSLTEHFSLAAVLRTPFIKKSESHSLLRYYSPGADTDIIIEAFSSDSFNQPLVVGVGASYSLSQTLVIASDVAFFNWSKYTADYFQEPLKRDFKNIIKISAGIEYRGAFRLFGTTLQSPTRVGFVYDPQPMKEPSSSYVYLCFGTGFRLRRFFIDLAAMAGIERGSGDSLKAIKAAVSLGYEL